MTDKLRVAIGYISLAACMFFGWFTDNLMGASTMAIISSIWFASVENKE